MPKGRSFRQSGPGCINVLVLVVYVNICIEGQVIPSITTRLQIVLVIILNDKWKKKTQKHKNTLYSDLAYFSHFVETSQLITDPVSTLSQLQQSHRNI